MAENDSRQAMTTDTYKPARPLKFFKDTQGNGWLCDKGIDHRRQCRISMTFCTR